MCDLNANESFRNQDIVESRHRGEDNVPGHVLVSKRCI
jgi:hypothetical protein